MIRAVGNPEERFKEDALRLMRAVRLATQLGFFIEKETMSAIRTHASLLSKIAEERIIIRKNSLLLNFKKKSFEVVKCFPITFISFNEYLYS